MAYRIEVTPAAARALTRVDHQHRDRIRGAIALLSHDPRPPGAKALQGRPGFHVRIGDYRIVYTIQDEVLLVVVVTLGHRRDVYNR
ncbi:type II toxin-antitoxin system RelE/ParE family toxin [Salinibacterium sp. UTAS2018]|uniref:type II toxin-antitoxin system RelE family toxin n=1 Tax=Salinibacterium sp. UTAS2018 TaxID=2508880 RepID=UPI0010096B1C|nr:type II toxin-antitoxin system RelE/ParE family toxin [Salinibacterium sp. UTAS2018]QAV71258.1 type II toxin-antitoxin system RelE/ParE family toxin [Salinibacterium sp. UTAS2018]